MVQNPVANMDDSELPNLTEHVPVSSSQQAQEVYDNCEIYLPKRQKKKVPPPPDNVLTEVTPDLPKIARDCSHERLNGRDPYGRSQSNSPDRASSPLREHNLAS